jgi:hypothetical protein
MGPHGQRPIDGNGRKISRHGHILRNIRDSLSLFSGGAVLSCLRLKVVARTNEGYAFTKDV